jgi:hypothetical protein
MGELKWEEGNDDDDDDSIENLYLTRRELEILFEVKFKLFLRKDSS